MKVFFHNFNPESNSGPNKFTRQLATNLINREKIQIARSQNEADAEFCLISRALLRVKPTLLRLDGIYFNSKQDFMSQNEPIKFAYKTSDCVVFQSEFNKELTIKWFGPHENTCVIPNMPDYSKISLARPEIFDKVVDREVDVWSCASSWRPHKRLSENLRYFLEFSNPDSVCLVAGKDADLSIIREYEKKSEGRVKYVGELGYLELLSLYKRSSHFVHLAYMDHCPNVVVDAQASGCKVVCSSSGGTSEIVSNGIEIEDPEWNFKAIDLYDPPSMNFDKSTDLKKSLTGDIQVAADLYYDKLLEITDDRD